jgi:hypothetical protein
MKQTKIALASGIVLTAMELDAAEREAALRMPMKDAMKDAAMVLAAKLDAALLQLLQLYYRAEGEIEPEEQATLELVMQITGCRPGRLTIHPSIELEQLPEKPGEVYAIDGVPLLWVGPVEIQAEGDPRDNTVRFHRSTATLYPPTDVGLAEPASETAHRGDVGPD